MYVKKHVFVDGKALVKPKRPQRRAAEQLWVRRGQKSCVKQQWAQRIAQRGEAAVIARGQVVRRGDIAGADPRQPEQNHPGIGLDIRQRRPKAGQQRVIGIKKQYPFAARGVQPRVARRPRAAVRAVQRADAQVSGGQLVTECTGAVRAAVVDEQQLHAVGRVGQGTVHGTAQGAHGLVAGDDD